GGEVGRGKGGGDDENRQRTRPNDLHTRLPRFLRLTGDPERAFERDGQNTSGAIRVKPNGARSPRGPPVRLTTTPAGSTRDPVGKGGEPLHHTVGHSGPLGWYSRYRRPTVGRRGKPGGTNGSTRGELMSLRRFRVSK